MKTDPYTVAVVLATGAGFVAGVVGVGALIGGAFWVAMRAEDRHQARARETTRRLP